MTTAGAVRHSENPLATFASLLAARRHHMITGRMDFCMDERGLKSTNTTPILPPVIPKRA